MGNQTMSQPEKLEPLEKCIHCKGQGWIRPMFHKLNCDPCSGTGLELSDMVAVIVKQQQFLVNAKASIIHQRRQIFDLTVSKDDQTKQAMDKFYSTIKLVN